ncbi:MAG: hypothetical protein ABI810_11165 [Sphingomonas bacterium]
MTGDFGTLGSARKLDIAAPSLMKCPDPIVEPATAPSPSPTN